MSELKLHQELTWMSQIKCFVHSIHIDDEIEEYQLCTLIGSSVSEWKSRAVIDFHTVDWDKFSKEHQGSKTLITDKTTRNI